MIVYLLIGVKFCCLEGFKLVLCLKNGIVFGVDVDGIEKVVCFCIFFCILFLGLVVLWIVVVVLCC